MKRRKFIKYTALASGSLIASSELLLPKQSDAFILLLLSLRRGFLLDAAFGALMEGAFNVATVAWQRRRQEWFDKRLAAQLAQQSLLDKLFSDVQVAEVENPDYRYILAGISQERLGENVAFSFPRLINNRPTIATFSGPASVGIAAAAKYLRKNTRMSSAQIQRAIFPPANAAARFHDNLSGWDTSGEIAYPTAYQPGSAGVIIRYQPTNPRPGGYGDIEVTINAERPIVIKGIKVQYSPS